MSSSPPLLRCGLVLFAAVALVCGRPCHAAPAAGTAATTGRSPPKVRPRSIAANQGPEGNWGSNDLGLVAVGGLAFLSAGHMPGIGEHGEACKRALD
ncbi:MAG: hypothetical protein ACKOEX_02680, partial [Planctomycetia bacterium]